MTSLVMLAAIAAQPAPAIVNDDLVCKRIVVRGETGTLLKRDSGERLCLTEAEWDEIKHSQVRLARAVDAR